jgi:hypothetical protein
VGIVLDVVILCLFVVFSVGSEPDLKNSRPKWGWF